MATFLLYLDLWTQEYYMKDNVLTIGSGAMLPAVVTLNVDGDKYSFADCNISIAEETSESIKIFPESVRKKALRMESKFKTDSAKTSEERAREYFHIKTDEEINNY